MTWNVNTQPPPPYVHLFTHMLYVYAVVMTTQNDVHDMVTVGGTSTNHLRYGYHGEC